MSLLLINLDSKHVTPFENVPTFANLQCGASLPSQFSLKTAGRDMLLHWDDFLIFVDKYRQQEVREAHNYSNCFTNRIFVEP